MAPLKLYGDEMSQPTRAVWMLLLDSKQPFEFKRIMISQGQTRTKEFLAINPNGHVPAIDDNGVLLHESHAIMRYIASKYKMDDHWYPADLVTRARIDQFLDWHHTYLRRGSSQLVFSSQFGVALGQLTPEQAARGTKEGQALLNKSLKRMEQSYLPSAEGFLMGQAQPSIADLSAATELYMTAQLVGLDLKAAYPKVHAWLQRTEQALPQAWPTAHATLNKVIAKRAAKKAAAAAGPQSKL